MPSLGLGLGLDNDSGPKLTVRTTYESDFTADVDGWSKVNDGGSGTFAFNQTVDGETGCLKFTFGADKALQIRKSSVVDFGADLGAAYSVSFKIYVQNTGFDDQIEHIFGNFVDNNVQFSIDNTDRWVDVTISAVAAPSGWSGSSVGFNFDTANDFDSGDFFAIKDYKITIYE